jgi:hypothetical protein
MYAPLSKLNVKPIVDEVTVIMPLELVQVGCTIVTDGADGMPVIVFITTFAVAVEVHPSAFVTVKLKVPGKRLAMVVVVPAPAMLPGLMIQLPEGKPLNTTDPTGALHIGCIIVPTIGAAGVGGCAFITAADDGLEEHPAALVTIKLYVPLVRLEMVVVLPDPEILPGLIVQLPMGNPLNAIEPVATVQVGCVIIPKMGVDTAAGCAIITALDIALQLTLVTCLARTV